MADVVPLLDVLDIGLFEQALQIGWFLLFRLIGEYQSLRSISFCRYRSLLISIYSIFMSQVTVLSSAKIVFFGFSTQSERKKNAHQSFNSRRHKRSVFKRKRVQIILVRVWIHKKRADKKLGDRLSQAGRLGGEIQMIIKYMKIAIFFEGALSDSKNILGSLRQSWLTFSWKVVKLPLVLWECPGGDKRHFKSSFYLGCLEVIFKQRIVWHFRKPDPLTACWCFHIDGAIWTTREASKWRWKSIW